MKKIKKILLIIVISLVALFLILLIGMRIYFRAPVSSFYKVSDKAFVIPGTNKGFVSQGLTYSEKDNNFYLTGYMKDHSASPIYIVNKDSKKLIKKVLISNPDGSAFTGHCGGFTIYHNKIYLAGGEDCCLYVIDKEGLDKAENGASFAYEDIVSLKTDNDYIGVAFVTSYDDLLIAGEFYREPQYPTLPGHEITCADGKNKAFALAFKLDGNKAIPEKLYSLPGNVQGMEFSSDKLYLSTSWGTSISHIYIYDTSKVTSNSSYKVLGTEVPLYILDSTSLEKDIKTPPMSEEIVLIDGKLYQANESASDKYVFGKFTGGKYLYSSSF
ncbi:MAG: hypothetical protein K6C97_11615 [Treponema sp.]|nr:hypothetical protein [Treponema sp.]